MKRMSKDKQHQAMVETIADIIKDFLSGQYDRSVALELAEEVVEAIKSELVANERK